VASVGDATGTSVYIYGFTLADGAGPLDVPGVEQGPVELLVEGETAAVVTRVEGPEIRPKRANLLAHNRVLSRGARRNPLLPATFGTVAESEQRLREVLRCNRGPLVERLQQIRGRVEMGLAVRLVAPNIFEYFLATHQELRALRDRLYRPGRTPTLDEQIELGRLFDSLLQQGRERNSRKVIEAVRPYCAETRQIDPTDERVIVKLACLVSAGDTQDWERSVEEIARQYSDSYCFQVTGPSAPYHFANVSLELF